MQREREFEAVNAEAAQKWWHKFGAKALDILSAPEHKNVSGEVVTADEIADRTAIEAQAWELIDAYETRPKVLRENEAEDNARTALFEALTASGHMSVVELGGDQIEVHHQVVQRLLNSYFREDIASHERERNFAELCEELTVQATYEAICRGDVPPDTKVVTISDFAHPLGQDADKHGYRSANQKGMVRETAWEFKGGEIVRVIKQVSRSNTYAPGTMQQLQEVGFPLAPRRGESDVTLLSNQWLSISHGAVEVVQLLDRARRGMRVMYGEPITGETLPYERLEEVSRLREAEVDSRVKELAKYERTLDELLARGEIDEKGHMKRYVEALRENVRAICVLFPSYTRGALGEDVVDDYQKAHRLYESGDTAGASAAVSGASSRESAIVVCGMASETQVNDPNNPESNNEQTLQEILERELMKDWEKVTNCPICGNKGVNARKRGDIIEDRDYGCTLNVCTGDAKIGARAQQSAKELVGELPVETPQATEDRDFNAEFQAIIENAYGKGAVVKERIEVGGTRNDVERGGKVIASGIKLGQFALARK